MRLRPRLRTLGCVLAHRSFRGPVGSSLLLVGLFLATPVHADTAILLPPKGDARLPAIRQQAQAALREALLEQRIELLDYDEAHSKPGVDKCLSIDCAGKLAQSSGAQFVATLAVWANDQGVAETVFVTLVDKSGVRYPGRALVDSDDVDGATVAALLDARSLQLLGPGPWLSVHGKPEGAAVYLDGKRVGSLPFRASKRSGRYALEVRAPGHRTHIQSVDIPPNGARQVEVQTELRPAPQDAPAAAATRYPHSGAADTVEERSSPWNYVLGGALLAGGVALATIEPIQALVKDGDCADADCTQVYDFGTRSGLQLAAGAVLAGVGITWLVWQPLHITVITPGDGARLSIRGRF